MAVVIMADALTQFMLAGVSNMLAASVTNPIDVVKVRMQMDGEGAKSSGRFRGPLHCGRVLAMEETWKSLYRGLTASLMREASYSGMRMGFYEPVKQLLGASDPKNTSLHLKIAAGGITGAVGSAIANPLDLVKVRMQCQTGTGCRYSSTSAAFRSIVAEGGVGGLWRGCGPTVQRAALLTASQIPSYDHAKHYMMSKGYQDGSGLHFVCCMFAGVVAALVTSPVDMAKTRIMNTSSGHETYSSTFSALAHVARTEGPLALYKGFHSQWLRIGPHTTLSLMAFEKLRSLVGLGYI